MSRALQLWTAIQFRAPPATTSTCSFRLATLRAVTHSAPTHNCFEPCNSIFSRLQLCFQLLFLPRQLFTIPPLLLSELVQFSGQSFLAQHLSSRQNRVPQYSAAHGFVSTKDTPIVKTMQTCLPPSLPTLLRLYLPSNVCYHSLYRLPRSRLRLTHSQLFFSISFCVSSMHNDTCSGPCSCIFFSLLIHVRPI